MSDSDPLRRYIEAGIALTQLTRARAEAVVKELVKAGEVQREHAQERVEDLLDRSRKGTGDLAATIRGEIAEQLASMGFATKADLAALEARLTTRFAAAMGEPPIPGPGDDTPVTAGATGARPAKGAKAAKGATRTKPTAAAKGAAKAPATKAKARVAKAAPPGTAARTAEAAGAGTPSPAGPGTAGPGAAPGGRKAARSSPRRPAPGEG